MDKKGDTRDNDDNDDSHKSRTWKTLITIFVPVVMIFAIYLIVFRIYSSIYYAPRIRAIERQIAKFDESAGAELRDKIFRLRGKIGLNIDSLPTVKFQSDANDARRTMHDEDAADDIVQRRRIQRECLTVGIFLSKRDDYVDCRTVCHVSDGVEYKYFDQIGRIIDGRRSRIGSYCLPNDAAICNENTSIAIYGRDGWHCFPQTRAFNGEGGNRIVACNGSILDRATGKIWHNYIDSSLRFADIDERLNTSGEYRFVCPPDQLDRLGNSMVEAPFDRLTLIDNYCASMIPYAGKYIRPDFENNTCVCRERDDQPDIKYDPALKTCVPYAPNFTNFEATIRTDPCIETWSVHSQISNWQNMPIPCGIENNNADISYPACVQTRALIYDRIVPSAYALRETANDHLA